MGSNFSNQRCFNDWGKRKRICESTGIDRWFIYQIQKIVNCEKAIAETSLEDISPELLKEAKRLGFSDEQISKIMKDGSTDEDVYEKRKELGIIAGIQNGGHLQRRV